MKTLVISLLLTIILPVLSNAGQIVTIDSESDLPLNAKIFLPSGKAPFPAVVVLHGGGGLWSYDDVDSGIMTLQYRRWSRLLTAEGYAVLFVDSFTPRGIEGSFLGKRPSADEKKDDSLCSPAYVRPNDSIRALKYLESRDDVDASKVGLLGFSHGGSAALAAVMDPSIEKDEWTVQYKDSNGKTTLKKVPPPFAPGELRYKAIVAYYPGCGFFGYFGDIDEAQANEYMPYAPTLILFGRDDSLFTGGSPENLVNKSALQSESLNLPKNPLSIQIFHEAGHSFDNEGIAPSEVWGTREEPSEKAADRRGLQSTLRWFWRYVKDE